MLTSTRDAAQGPSELTSVAHSEKPAVLMRWPMHMLYDSRESRSTAEREADIFARLASVIEAAMRAPAYAERLRGIDPRTVASREALARLPVLRKSELPALQKADPPFAGFVAGAALRLRASLHLARADLRAGRPGSRPLGRGARAPCHGLRHGRRGAEHLQLPPRAGRLHDGFGRPGARLRRHPGRSRPDRAAARGDRRLPAGRLLRHAGLPQDPPRCRREGRPRRLLHHEGAGLRRRLPEVPPGGHRRARHRRLPGLRHRRYRRHRL